MTITTSNIINDRGVFVLCGFGKPITKEDTVKLKGHTLFGHKYREGDCIGYVLVVKNEKLEECEMALLKMDMCNIVVSEIPKFLSEYKLHDIYTDRYVKI